MLSVFIWKQDFGVILHYRVLKKAIEKTRRMTKGMAQLLRWEQQNLISLETIKTKGTQQRSIKLRTASFTEVIIYLLS